jgi:predicted glycosyltransferase
MGVIRVLDDDDLRPGRLAAIMDRWIHRSTLPSIDINLDGAANTAKWIEKSAAIRRGDSDPI